MIETPLLIIVFALFGLETLSRFGHWLFELWRDVTELRESLVDEDPPKSQ